ncbi:MAG: hypothetical protein SW833_22500 [Cyanobacteriota bacterium]|nr:hypothetical protein [Cyanobacteriota bacterium]
MRCTKTRRRGDRARRVADYPIFAPIDGYKRSLSTGDEGENL